MSLLPTHSPHDGAIAFVYHHVLHRDPTPAERAGWSAEMEHGLSFDAFLDLVSASDEASSVAEGELDVAVAAVGNLFSIALGRRPTPADVAGWTAQLKAGRPLASFIDEVLDSPEARGRYEQPDRDLEAEAISFVYRHAMGRDPTAGDVELWSRSMREGLSFPSFLVAVRSSDEGRARAATLAARSNADVIAFAYRHALGREAAEAEVAKWDENLRNGLSFEHFLRLLLTSEEARQRAAIDEEPPSADAIAFVYRFALGREPTEGDLRAWSSHLAAGLPFQRFLLDIVSSEEGRMRNEGSPLRSGERDDDTSAEDVIAFVHRHALGREPTEAEVREWSGHLRDGLPFSRFLSSILQSDEARARPPREPDEVAAESIAFVYQHAVGRDPTTADVAAWTGQFRSGLSFQGFLLGMLASEEARAHAAGKGRVGETAEALADGEAPARDVIAFVYRHALGRGPTEADVREWSGHLRDGLSFPRFLRSILESEEARARPARETDEAAVESIGFVYRHAVGRDPTTADVATWNDHLRSGLSFQDFLLGMLASEEARAHAAVTNHVGGMTDGQFVAHLFEICLGHCASPAQVQDWIRRFAEQGYRRADVAMSFIEAAIARDEVQNQAVWSHDPGNVSIMGTDQVLSAEAWAVRAAEIEAGRNPVSPERLSAPYVVRPHTIRVSAIASLYKGGQYIRKFLDNMTQQSLGENFELIIIDANSPDGERDLIATYQKAFRNIRYERMNYRIGIYDAWNVGVELARGQYLTNTNLDDLRRSDSLELQARTLDTVSFADIVYQDFFYSLNPDLSFGEVEAFGFRSSLPIVTPNNLIVYNSPHNAPMWRRRLHEDVGLFDTSLKSAGDHDFWLRCMRAGKIFYKINTPHVVYYQNPDGISTRPGTRGVVEGQQILKKYGRQLISPEIYRTRATLSSELSALTGVETAVNEAEDTYVAIQRAILSFAEQHALSERSVP